MEESLWISTPDGKKLEGLLRKPEGDGPFPAILFIPGLGMTLHEWNNSFDEISKLLVASGFLTLQFGFSIFYPDGVVRELALDKRAAQLKAVYQWLLSRSDVDRDHVGILAQSFGVPTLMAAHLANVRTTVFVSGSFFPYRSITKVYTERGTVINYSGDTTLPRSSGEHTTVGKEFWQSIKKFDPFKAVEKLTASVLVIHGDRDTKMPMTDTRRVFEAIPSQHKKLKIFKGGDHGIDQVPRAMREEFLREVVKWFKETL